MELYAELLQLKLMIEVLILKTPTSETRNELTEINTKLLLILDKIQ